MANTFKVKTNGAMPASAGTFLTLYTCPSSTQTIVIGLTLCNIHTAAVTCSVQLVSDTSDTETNANVSIAHNVPIPAGSSLKPFADNKQVLQTTDVLRVSASGNVDVAFSILEIT